MFVKRFFLFIFLSWPYFLCNASQDERTVIANQLLSEIINLSSNDIDNYIAVIMCHHYYGLDGKNLLDIVLQTINKKICLLEQENWQRKKSLFNESALYLVTSFLGILPALASYQYDMNHYEQGDMRGMFTANTLDKITTFGITISISAFCAAGKNLFNSEAFRISEDISKLVLIKQKIQKVLKNTYTLAPIIIS